MKITIETNNQNIKQQFLNQAEDYDVKAAERFNSVVLLGHDMDVLDLIREVSDWSSWEVSNED